MKTKAFRVPRTTADIKSMSAKDVLKFIERWTELQINKWSSGYGSNEPLHLWHILTALRGPDSDNTAQKNATTVIIRNHSLPKLSRWCGAHVRDGSLSQMRSTYSSNDGFDHFIHHIMMACSALLKKE